MEGPAVAVEFSEVRFLSVDWVFGGLSQLLRRQPRPCAAWDKEMATVRNGGDQPE